jgi:hypothetical protein
MSAPLWMTLARRFAVAAMAVGAWRGLKAARRRSPRDDGRRPEA